MPTRDSDRPAPIAFFAFNRPDHTRQTLEALSLNPEASTSQLYIYCDGPRNEESEEGLKNIEEVRMIACSKQWAGEVNLRFRDENFGCAKSLINGISEVLSQHSEIIVLEDDILVAEGFLEFMNDALRMYRDNPEVMHVAGYSPLNSVPSWYESTTMFLNRTNVGWGWATWRRAWDMLSVDGNALRRRIDRQGIKKYVNADFGYEVYWALKYLDDGLSQDWNCYWTASVLVNNGYCLHPTASLADNIGFDGSGTHCTIRDGRLRRPVAQSVKVNRIPISENTQLRRIAIVRPWWHRATIRSKDLARKIYFDLLGFNRRFWRSR